MTDAEASPPPQIPSLSRRLILGAVRFIPALVILVAVPVGAIQVLSQHHVSVPVSVLHVTLAGLLLAFLGAVRYVVRPTPAYGPVWLVYSGFAVLYLWSLIPLASATLHLSGSASATVGFSEVLLLLMLVPGISFAAGVVTTIEDRLHPGERVRLDYPA